MVGDGTAAMIKNQPVDASIGFTQAVFFLWMNKAGDVDMGGLAHVVGKP